MRKHPAHSATGDEVSKTYINTISSVASSKLFLVVPGRSTHSGFRPRY